MNTSRPHRRGRIGIETWYVLMVVLSLATAASWAARRVREAETPWRGLLWGVCGALGVAVYYFGLPLAMAWLIGLLSGFRRAVDRDNDTTDDLRKDRQATVFYYCMIAVMIPPPIALAAWLAWRLAT